MKQAALANKELDYINACLDYAYPIYTAGFPVIYDIHHLSLLVGYKKGYLYSVSNAPEFFYRKFVIPKKNGKQREIHEPLPSLKEIQHWILHNILSKFEISKFSKAYSAGSSVKHNARFHRNQNQLLKLDIKDFFPSISLYNVFGLFYSVGYTKQLSMMLAKLCCFDGRLPQGAPTSPSISNIIMKNVDARLGAFAVKNKIRYTRYADDMAFSGDFKAGDVISLTEKILKEYGFKLNKDKTRLMHNHQRQIITGITVNEIMNVKREARQFLRKEAYFINKFGLQAHLDKIGNTEPYYLHRLIGLASFALYVRPDNEEMKQILGILKSAIEN